MTTIPSRRAPASLPGAPLALATTLALLVGCSDGTGGAAGDDDLEDTFAPNPVEPLVGVWELNGPLNGLPEDEALLVIRPVAEDGEARVLVYELEGRDNCYIRSFSNGRAFPDPAFRNRVFIRNVASFEEGELGLSDGALVIDYFDSFDVDGDGDTGERATFVARSVGVSETDIENQRCT